jgi:hypothetical protein
MNTQNQCGRTRPKRIRTSKTTANITGKNKNASRRTLISTLIEQNTCLDSRPKLMETTEANNKHQTQLHQSPHKPTGNTATITPTNTMVTDDRLREDMRRTGRVRKQQRILQQARRNAEAQEHTPGD